MAAPRSPLTQSTERMRRLDDAVTADAIEREAVGLVGTSTQLAVDVIETDEPTLSVNVGTGGEHEEPPFVNVAPLAPVTIGESHAAESFGRRPEPHQVSVFHTSQADAIAMRETLLAAFAAEAGVWQLTDADFEPQPDPTLPTAAWMAPFTVRHMT